MPLLARPLVFDSPASPSLKAGDKAVGSRVVDEESITRCDLVHAWHCAVRLSFFLSALSFFCPRASTPLCSVNYVLSCRWADM